MDDDELAERWDRFDTAQANIYRVDPAREPFDDLVELAHRAGLDGEVGWQDMGSVLGFEQEPYVLTVYRPSRGVQCIDSRRWQVDDGTSALEVSDDVAIEVAMREFNRLELAAESAFRPTKVTRLNVASGQKGGVPVNPRVIDVGVVLTRIIDDLTVEGQGGNIVIYLDWSLELTGFQRIARRIAEIHEPVLGWRPLGDVLREIEAYWAKEHHRELTIENVRLCYVELGRLQDQEFVQPAYALTLRLTNHVNDEVRMVEHYTPAARNGIGQLMPSDFGPPSGRR